MSAIVSRRIWRLADQDRGRYFGVRMGVGSGRSARLQAAVLLAFGAATLFAGCAPEPEEIPPLRPVRVMRVSDIAMVDGRVFPGRAQATRVVDLSFRVSGPLVVRPVNVGDAVVTGQELAAIDPRDFEVRLRSSQAKLEEARADERRLAEEYRRAQDAYSRGAVSDIELTRVREASAAATARVDEFTAAVEAETDALNYTHLKAPFDGTVVAIYVENHEDVNAKQVVLRLLDDSSIEMIIEIPEQLISLVPLVENIRCRFDAFPDLDLPATIKEIGTEASETTRTYPVTLVMDQPEEVRILPGMTGEARGKAPPPDDITSDGYEVPTSAILSSDGVSSSVWVIDESSMTVKRREITLDITTPRGVLVHGLEPGELIVTAGVHYLGAGQTVRILDAITFESSPEDDS